MAEEQRWSQLYIDGIEYLADHYFLRAQLLSHEGYFIYLFILYFHLKAKQKSEEKKKKTYPSLSFNHLGTKNPHAKNITESFRL